jgi:hypothetical protein
MPYTPTVSDVSHDEVLTQIRALAECMDDEHDSFMPRNAEALQRKIALGMIASAIWRLADDVRDGKQTVVMLTTG